MTIEIENFINTKIKDINKSIKKATDIPNKDYKKYLTLNNKLNKKIINKKEYEDEKSKITYFFNAAQLRNFLFNKSVKKFKNLKKSKLLLEKIRNEKYLKSKIEQIANEEFIYKKDLEKFYTQNMHAELSDCVDYKKLENDFIDLLIANSKFDTTKFDKFIKKNILNLFPYFSYHLIRNGFPINIQGLNNGTMFANAGDSGEHFFVARAILAGFNASVVDVRSSSYDVIIDIDRKLLRVQIKSFDAGIFSRKGRPRGGQGIDSLDPSNQSVLVTSKDCDIFATIIKTTGTVFMFIGSEIDSLPKENFKAKDYKKNQENWNVINKLQ